MVQKRNAVKHQSVSELPGPWWRPSAAELLVRFPGGSPLYSANTPNAGTPSAPDTLTDTLALENRVEPRSGVRLERREDVRVRVQRQTDLRVAERLHDGHAVHLVISRTGVLPRPEFRSAETLQAVPASADGHAARDSVRPCPHCGRTFAGLCSAVDALRRENGELRIEAARYRDADEASTRGPATTSATVRELRLELAEAQQQISELERANRHWRDIAAAERSRAAAAEDALRRGKSSAGRFRRAV